MVRIAPSPGSPLRPVSGGAARARGAVMRVGAALSLAASLLAPSLFGPGIAQAADTWTVQVGGDNEADLYEPQAFFPDPLIIHVGDTVNYQWAGVHTVTFNSGKPELPGIVPGPNPGELMVGPGWLPFGITDPTKPIMYDGTQQISSGAPLGSSPSDMKMSMTFTKTGTFGYVCTIHPGMRGNIEVREAGAPLTETPAQATQRGQLTLSALQGKVNADARSIRPLDVGTVHTVASGVGDTFGASKTAFLPGNVTVKRGDSVVWYLPDPFDPHTVTFTSGATAPDLIQPRPQPSGPPQLVFPANVASPTGGNSYTGSGYLNSGILLGGGAFVATIDAAPGTYTYFCLIHGSPNGGMRGTITVTG